MVPNNCKNAGLVINRGFCLDNFVGTYHIVFDPELGKEVIVSTEYNHPRDGEIPLMRKRLFEYDARDSDYTYINFANVQIESHESILAYCNRHGLPYSSQLISDKIQVLDENTDKATADEVSSSGTWRYRRNDLMTVDGFCNDVTRVKKLLKLKTLADELYPSQNWYNELISTLIYFLFFSHKDIYKFENGETLPNNPIMRFQYEFHRFLHTWPFPDQPYENAARFLKYCIDCQGADADEVRPDYFAADIHSRFVGQAIDELCRILFYSPTPGELRLDNLFRYRGYGDIKFCKPLLWERSADEARDLRRLALEVFRSVINEELRFSSPTLALDSDGISCSWNLSYQMDGIYLQLFLEAANNEKYQQCANPTCGNFFSVSKSRTNKKYCCDECRYLVNKRQQRAAKKTSKQSAHE